MKIKLTYLTTAFLISFTVGFTAMAVNILGETKSSPGVVTVDLTPKKFADGELVFKITVNTHSVNDLHKFDLKKIAVLHVGKKKIYPAEAPKLRGHHSGGKLIYKLESEPKMFKITINGLNEPANREFAWP